MPFVGVEQLSVDMYPASAEGVACSCGWIWGSAEDDADPAALGIGLTLLLRPKGNSGSIKGLTELSMARDADAESAGDAEDMPPPTATGGDSAIIDASLDGSR